MQALRRKGHDAEARCAGTVYLLVSGVSALGGRWGGSGGKESGHQTTENWPLTLQVESAVVGG
jgi:hypothetical protein